MDRWQSEIDREIEKMLQEADLPGAGQPLDLKTDRHIPADQRMAYKIMRDHDALPEWIMLGKDLEREETALRDRIRRHKRDYQLALAGAESDTVRGHVERAWRTTCADLQKRIDKYNDKVLTYNLKVPPGIRHRRPIRLRDEI